jgi:hypothetical protein
MADARNGVTLTAHSGHAAHGGGRFGAYRWMGHPRQACSATAAPLTQHLCSTAARRLQSDYPSPPVPGDARYQGPDIRIHLPERRSEDAGERPNRPSDRQRCATPTDLLLTGVGISEEASIVPLQGGGLYGNRRAARTPACATVPRGRHLRGLAGEFLALQVSIEDLGVKMAIPRPRYWDALMRQ